MSKTIDFKNRYLKNLNTISLKEQAILEKSKVVVLGLGGIGGGVCEMLARVGVGNLTLVDGDVFEDSNLNRQLLCQEDLIGENKALAAQKRVSAINSKIKTNCISKYLDKSNIYEAIKNHDVIVDCLDSIDDRFMLEKAAKKALLPIVSGAIAGITAQTTTIFPNDKGYKAIYGNYDDQKKSKGVELETGNISYCALFSACLQSSECVKILLNKGNLLRNKLLIAQLLTNSFEIIDLI